ncbi:beta-galactosidase [Caldisalinibacter kiritimatiensis]|uniref:Beta-galactosidase n=1 Tax=Caldisalinibacter kiritimatiensis TaxID=1304284 RepID=R1AX13_9FIRM|nr:beta-galactosidase [Caldisalinibacter kiritimatiensis]EOD01202.1 Beta-galactosidase [Caldisalinibacter kiritimatiensis]
MIDIKNEKVMINGHERMLYGGELHYFRVPREEWRNRIQKIKEAGCNMISTYIPWIWHEQEEGKIDLTGYTRAERDLNSFLKLLYEENVYCLVRPGPYVMAELKQEGLPDWVLDKYPEVIARKQDGQIHPTKVVSYMHPKFLELVSKWYKAVCEIIEPYQITKGGPIIMFQLDNEVGMLQWVTNQADYSDITLNYFRDYLIDEYKSLDNLKEKFRVNVSSFEEFAFEYTLNQEENYALPLHYEWGYFMRNYYKKYINKLKEIAEGYGIEVPFVVNIHGFTTHDLSKRGIAYPIGISQLHDTAEIDKVVLAGDYYIGNVNYDNYHDIIIANAFTKAVQSDKQPLFSAEFQGGCISDIPRLQPSAFDLNTRICVAHGMNGLNYYMFAGGENYEDIGLFGRRHEWQAPLSSKGEEREHYYKIKYLGKMFRIFEKEILSTKKATQTYLGFYPDYYMTEYFNEYTKDMVNKITAYRDHFGFNGVIRGLTVANISYEGYNLLKESEILVDKIPSLWVLTTDWMSADIQMKLLRYIKNGGKLVLFPTVPTKDFDGKDCTILLDGIDIEFKDRLHVRHELNVKGMDSVVVSYSESYQGDNIETIAVREKDKTEDITAFSKYVGDGKVVVFGVGMEFDFHYKKQVILDIAEEIELKPLVDKTDNFLEVVIREDENSKKFVFIHNYDEYARKTKITYKGQLLFDGNEIMIPPRSGVMLPINCLVYDDIVVNYSTLEIFDIIKDNKAVTLLIKTFGQGEILLTSKKYLPLNYDEIWENEDGYSYKVTIDSTDEVFKLILANRENIS